MDVRVEDSYMPLYSAALRTQNFDLVEALGAAMFNEIEDSSVGEGWTSLHAAVGIARSPALVEALITAGADPSALTEDGHTAWELIEDDSPVQGTDVYWKLKQMHEGIDGDPES